MKKLLLLASAAGIGLASPAVAQAATTGPATENFTIAGATPQKCDISAASNVVDMTDFDLTDDQGRAKGDIGARVAQGLNAAQVFAWCTGNNNTISIERTALANGDGVKTSSGFNKAAIYDVQLTIPGSVFQFATQAESSSDGVTPGVPLYRFGPDGDGSPVTFSNDGTSTAVANSQGSNTFFRNAYGSDADRMVAGNYTGTVRIVLNPGL